MHLFSLILVIYLSSPALGFPTRETDIILDKVSTGNLIVDSCIPSVDNDCHQETLQFIGWHGTIMQHAESIENKIRIDDDKDSGARFGPGCYIADSIMKSRVFSELSGSKCRGDDNIEDKNLCYPAICAIYAPSSEWPRIPKVLVNKFFTNAKTGMQTAMWYQYEVAEKIINAFSKEKHYNIFPALFSIFGASDGMQITLKRPHAEFLSAVCVKDSTAREARRHGYSFLSSQGPKYAEAYEKGGTAYARFGDKFGQMLNLKYSELIRSDTQGWQADEL
ncbi:hypothetical protein BKA69DRAFT_1046661 [Paraphysoderma sedebokerense]|nr:hypothetical protein BKA69DRAFT_1046661 [Paraphysoderma sedebokerense]